MCKSELPAKSGVYTLIIEVTEPVRVEVGKLGLIDFGQGLYTYTGSAIGGSVSLRARVGRHLTSEKKRRWHIDYLLSSKGIAVRAVVCVETHLKMECQIAKSIEQSANGKSLIRGFGSSDCRNGCATHLHYFPIVPLEEIVSRVAKIYEQAFNDSSPIHILRT